MPHLVIVYVTFSYFAARLTTSVENQQAQQRLGAFLRNLKKKNPQSKICLVDMIFKAGFNLPMLTATSEEIESAVDMYHQPKNHGSFKAKVKGVYSDPNSDKMIYPQECADTLKSIILESSLTNYGGIPADHVVWSITDNIDGLDGEHCDDETNLRTATTHLATQAQMMRTAYAEVMKKQS